MLGIVVALPVEGKTLHGGTLQVGQTVSLSPAILLRISGMGPQRALAAATALRQKGAVALMSWGCSAALTPALHAGDLLLPERFVMPGGESAHSDRAWQQRLAERLRTLTPPHTAPLAGSDAILATSDDKQRLQRQTGAAAADMEAAFLARWAKRSAMPFVAIRSISDCARTGLPTAVQAATDDQGDIDLLKLIHHIACHPGQIPSLIRLSRQFGRARNRLLQAAEALRPNGFCLPC